MSFSADGNHIIMEAHNGIKRWNILPSGGSSGHITGSPSSQTLPEATSFTMVSVPTPSDEPAYSHDDLWCGPYRHPVGSEWIIDRDNRRLCWIPADRRCSDVHGPKVILGTASGRVIIVDLSGITLS